jgi:hypothetical protein
MNHQNQSQLPAQASSKASVQPGISKPEYHQARRLIGEHGRAAFAILSPRVFQVMDLVQSIRDSTDPLTERAAIVAYCAREGIACNVRHTRIVK